MINLDQVSAPELHGMTHSARIRHFPRVFALFSTGFLAIFLRGLFNVVFNGPVFFYTFVSYIIGKFGVEARGVSFLQFNTSAVANWGTISLGNEESHLTFNWRQILL